jgi:hypothetical protein
MDNIVMGRWLIVFLILIDIMLSDWYGTAALIIATVIDSVLSFHRKAGGDEPQMI